MLKIVAPVLAIVLVLPSLGLAAPRMTLDQAEQLCTKRAIAFGKQPHGWDGDEPSPNLVQDRYRACVYANSGQYPRGKVVYRESILRELGIIK